jgi:hypothetical protein
VLHTADRHEPIAERPFDEARARDAIARIVERADSELDAGDGRWPLDPDDRDDEHTPRGSGLYFGGAGIAWALGELADAGYAASGVVERELVERLEQHMLAEPDDPELGSGGVWTGIPGVLAVAERRWPDAARRDRLHAFAQAALDSPALEILYGHPGHMALAAQLHARTGEPRWAAFWSLGADRLLARWERDPELGAWLWTQQLGSRPWRFVGAAHGLAGNVHVLLSGGALLAAERRAEVEQRAVESLTRLAVVEDGRANWPPAAGSPLEGRGGIRVQWCNGAPGVVACTWPLAQDDEAWSALLLAGGRLVWEAGPLRAPGLCHGTAGNAYALLGLWQRTRDERWLARARAFAQHAAGQVEERVKRLGHGRHSLYTGDEGVALCLASAIAGDAHMPAVDRLI